jgi:hypothetical protein
MFCSSPALQKEFFSVRSRSASAGASCRQTGTFTNPLGQSFSGLTNN